MKKIFLINLIFILSVYGYSQIGGISNSKLYSINTDIIKRHTIEFEPTVYHTNSIKYWDSNGNLQNSFSTADSALKNTGLSFRFTYGLWDVLEIGGSISTELGSTSLGVKYKFWSNQSMAFAAMAGANIPLGNKTIDKTIRLSDQITSLGAGLIYTVTFSEVFSLDANAQYLFFAEETDDKNKGTLYLSSDIGYYVFDRKLQLIGGLGYFNSSFESFNSSSLTVYPGCTVETGNNFVIVLQAPFDVNGKNALKNAGFVISLTLGFN